MRDGVVVRRLIAGSRHKRDAGIPHGTNRLLNDDRKAGRSLPAGIHGHDVDAVVPTHHRDIVDGLDDRTRVADAATVLNLERHQRHLPADPSDTDAIVAHGPDDARDMGAVAVAIGHLVIVVDEVPAVGVVLIAVLVIVNGIARGVTRIRPDVGGQIGMGDVDAGVDHRHDDVPRTGRHAPSLRGIDVVADGSGILAGVLQVPLRRHERIIGPRGGADGEIRLEPRHGLRVRRPVEHRIASRAGSCQREEPVAKRRGVPTGMANRERPDEHRTADDRLGLGRVAKMGNGETPHPVIHPGLDGVPPPLNAFKVCCRRR